MRTFVTFMNHNILGWDCCAAAWVNVSKFILTVVFCQNAGQWCRVKPFFKIHFENWENMVKMLQTTSKFPKIFANI